MSVIRGRKIGGRGNGSSACCHRSSLRGPAERSRRGSIPRYLRGVAAYVIASAHAILWVDLRWRHTKFGLASMGHATDAFWLAAVELLR